MSFFNERLAARELYEPACPQRLARSVTVPFTAQEPGLETEALEEYPIFLVDRFLRV
jgi:hypothetical protein